MSFQTASHSLNWAFNGKENLVILPVRDQNTPSTHIFKHPLKRTTEFKVLLLLFLPNFTPFPGNRMVQEVKKLNSQYNSAIFSTLPANRMVQYAKS